MAISITIGSTTSKPNYVSASVFTGANQFIISTGVGTYMSATIAVTAATIGPAIRALTTSPILGTTGTFTGTVTSSSGLAAPFISAFATGIGGSDMVTGNGTTTGIARFINSVGVRQGYVGSMLTGGTMNFLNDTASSGFTFNGPVKLPSFTVLTLPSASAVGAGATAYVSNATVSTFYSIVAGGGAIGVPVFSDGTNWRIG